MVSLLHRNSPPCTIGGPLTLIRMSLDDKHIKRENSHNTMSGSKPLVVCFFTGEIKKRKKIVLLVIKIL